MVSGDRDTVALAGFEMCAPSDTHSTSVAQRPAPSYRGRYIRRDMDSDELASMTASIVMGVSKEDSDLVTDAESARTWDRVKVSIDETRRRFPGAVIDIPS